MKKLFYITPFGLRYNTIEFGKVLFSVAELPVGALVQFPINKIRSGNFYISKLIDTGNKNLNNMLIKSQKRKARWLKN